MVQALLWFQILPKFKSLTLVHGSEGLKYFILIKIMHLQPIFLGGKYFEYKIIIMMIIIIIIIIMQRSFVLSFCPKH